MQRRSSVRLGIAVAAISVVAVVASGCSSSKRSGDNTGPGNTNTQSTSTGGNAAAPAKFGTLPSPCGKGDAKGATDQGVTDTEITIGYGDDRGFAQSPGLNKNIGDAVKAMIKWCNDQGGINGRTIKGNFYDAAITQANAVMQKACKTDFMLVGNGFAGDEGGEQTRVACNLPMVPAFTVGPDVANGPMMYQALPNPTDFQPSAIIFQLKDQFPDIVGKLAVMKSTLPAQQASWLKVEAAAKDAGYTSLGDCGATMNYTGEPNYVPFANKLKDCGAKAVYVAGSPGPQAFDMFTAMNQVGAHPIYFGQTQWYIPQMAQWNTAGYADQLYVMTAFQPMEHADSVPAVKDYLDIVKADGGDTGVLGMQATSSFLLWATAAKDCGSDLTRQCMINKLSKVHNWTGGGLNAPTDPASNMPVSCGMILKLDKTKWTQFFPAETGKFDCNDKYVAKVPQQAWGTTLNADRIATKFLTKDYIKPQS